MKNKTIYLFIFLVQVLWAQTKPLFPGSEIDIYKIIKNNRQIDFLRYIGSSKSEVEFES